MRTHEKFRNELVPVLPSSLKSHPKMPQSTRWCCTLNNYNAEESARFAEVAQSPGCLYAIVGREVGDGGTPHLQSYFVFARNKRLCAIRRLLGGRGHYEVARGTAQENQAYCSKDGDYDEYGAIPPAAGSASPFKRFEEWVVGLDHGPSEREIARAFPGLFVRYSRRLSVLANHLRPIPELVPNPPPSDVEAGALSVVEMPTLRVWQATLEALLREEADDRKIVFVVDPDGNNGKSWYTRFYYQRYPEKTQLLGVGKRDDMAHAIDETKTVFFVNVPRGSMEFLQYSVLEMLKDRVVYSPKYDSRTKLLPGNAHVVVMSNEYPDMNALSNDRYEAMDISNA